MPALKPAEESQPDMTVPTEAQQRRDATPQEPWFDEAVVVDADWAVIYTKRDDGSRRGIRVPLRAVLAPEDDEPDARATG